MRKGKVASFVIGLTMTLGGAYGISKDSKTANIIGGAGCLIGIGLMAYSISSSRKYDSGDGGFLDWVFLDGYDITDAGNDDFGGFGGGSSGGGGAGGDWGDSDFSGGDDYKPSVPEDGNNGFSPRRSFRTKLPTPHF